MKDKYFLDTNIIIYSFDSENKAKQTIARNLIAQGLGNQSTCISYQVIQEFLNVALKKFKIPLSPSDAQKYITITLAPLCEVFSSIPLYHKAIDIQERWKFSFYDSLIIAAALSSNCTILYSEDMQHKQKIEDIIIINPFIESSQYSGKY